MRITRYSLLIIFLIQITACKPKQAIVTNDFIPMIKADVDYLASDKLEGRDTGSDGEKAAAEYIIKRFKDLGITAGGYDHSYYQAFSKKIKANPHSDQPSDGDYTIKGNNVIGFIDNNKKNTVVIGAHYDHLGLGHEGSLWSGEPEIHNGADDNASGVAALLELASLLKSKANQSNNYMFIAFSGEEKGLLGSNYFVKNPTIPIASINYMINMDMVGRLNADRQLAIYGNGTSPSWNTILPKIKTPKFKLSFKESGVGPSDHTSFYLQDIPVLHFFTGQHADYHKPSDDAHLVNIDGIKDVVIFIDKLIGALNSKGKLSFTKTNDESEKVPAFKVTLGVIPDYLFEGKGMRIDGISEGKPAFRANLQKGDIVIKMGEYEVADMMSYMRALSKFEPGGSTEITIDRDGEKLIKSIRFNQ